MSRSRPTPDSRAKASESSWRSLYAVGGVAALLTLTGTIADLVLTMLPGWGVASVPATLPAWFAQLHSTPLLGLRNLDLLNITLAVIALPMYLALYGAHRQANPGQAALALLVVLLGTAVFVANNAALPLLALARQYAVAATDAQRLALEAAGSALLAKGAHGSPGAFAGFFLSSLGTGLMGLTLFKGHVFGRATAVVGLVGIILLTLYIIGVTFAPAAAPAMMAVAGFGGLLALIWYGLVARKLFRLSAARA